MIRVIMTLMHEETLIYHSNAQTRDKSEVVMALPLSVVISSHWTLAPWYSVLRYFYD